MNDQINKWRTRDESPMQKIPNNLWSYSALKEVECKSPHLKC